MGLAFSGLWQRMFGKEERRILMVGLDAAGPHAAGLDCAWRLGEFLRTMPREKWATCSEQLLELWVWRRLRWVFSSSQMMKSAHVGCGRSLACV